MKNKKNITVLLLVLLCFALSAIAQEKEKKKEVYRQAFQVVEDHVKPSMVVEYEATLKEFMAFLKEQGYTYPMHTFKTDDYFYYFSTPIGSSAAAMDTLNKALSDAVLKDLEKWKKLWKGFDDTYHYSKSYMIHYNSELSYEVNNPDIKPGEKHYTDLSFIYPIIGKNSEFKKICKKWVEIYKNNKIPLGFQTYWGGFGTEQPMVLWVTNEKTRLDFWTKSDATNKKFKGNKEVEELWKKTLKLMRKVEYKSAYYLPDLSYYPEKKK